MASGPMSLLGGGGTPPDSTCHGQCTSPGGKPLVVTQKDFLVDINNFDARPNQTRCKRDPVCSCIEYVRSDVLRSDVLRSDVLRSDVLKTKG